MLSAFARSCGGGLAVAAWEARHGRAGPAWAWWQPARATARAERSLAWFRPVAAAASALRSPTAQLRLTFKAKCTAIGLVEVCVRDVQQSGD